MEIIRIIGIGLISLIIILVLRQYKPEFAIYVSLITGIAFLTEFAVSISNDCGETAIANKIDLGGKVLIIVISIPIITALLETILKVIP